ncbi:hypothetical protein ACRYCC_09155 [Actinomadura scrupuli]|uniref:hypothetical protein n=1 Tax=Actinomadura scrupuli TaxID=559629 RepID=UPI003D95FE6E
MDWTRIEVAGIPTFWSEGQGPLKAGLIFRVGHADETLATRGITHLVEHLALHPIGQPAHHYNGQVDAITTAFTTEGSPDEVADFLSSICRSLHDLPVDRLKVENRILQTEEDGRRAGPLGALLLWRYGAATYGLPGYEEFGIGLHTPEQLGAWGRRWFTQGNAVLALIGGPPPEGLRLELPAGERIAPPAPSSALPRTPAYFNEQLNGVAMLSAVPRSAAAQAYSLLLARRLHRTLRQDSGISYSPTADYMPRDTGTAHVTAFADGLEDSHAKLIAQFVEEIERLATEPGAQDELDKIITQMRARVSDPEAIAGVAVGAAMRELLGSEPLDRAALLAEIDALDARAVQETAAQALDAALLMLPRGHEPQGRRFHMAPASSPGTVDGRTLRSADAPIDRDRLIIGPEGVSLVHGPRYVTVKFSACEAMLAWPDGARRLYGRDGFSLHLEPTLWENGGSIPEALDRAVPADRVIPQQARSEDHIPQPRTSRLERARARLKRR